MSRWSGSLSTQTPGVDWKHRSKAWNASASASSAAAISAPPTSRRRRLPDPGRAGRCRFERRRGRRTRRRVRHAGDQRRGAACRSGDRDRREPDRPEGACGGRAAGRRRRQARPFGKAARHQHRRGAQARRSGAGARGQARLGARYVSRRRAIRRPASSSTRAPSARRLPAPPSSCAPATRAGIPNPGFYYLAGGGPMLDMGPYYITDLVNLLGPVAKVRGMASRIRSQRLVTSEPLAGTHVPVEVATHVAGTLAFVSGAIVTVVMSFDVARHRHRPIELYGTEGAMSVPDPNWFGGAIELGDGGRGLDGRADRAHLCRRQLPHHRRGRHGDRPSARAARIAPAASWPFTCWRSWRRSSAPPTAAPMSSSAAARIDRPRCRRVSTG